MRIHVALDGERGMVLSVEVTGYEGVDAAVLAEVMAGVQGRVRQVIADGGSMIGENSAGVKIVIPPRKGRLRGVEEHPRDEHLRYIRWRG